MWEGILQNIMPPTLNLTEVGKGEFDCNYVPLKAQEGHELATFAGGCFWGMEYRFRQVPGVVATAVGYTGGTKENPSYEDVCGKKTGHAEAILIEFDPKQISYSRLLDYLWDYHNPTTLNRQGPDVGTQYRSVVFYHSPEQEAAAKASMQKAQARYNKPIVTQLVPAAPFWMAETYHQQYHQKTGTLACPIDKG